MFIIHLASFNYEGAKPPSITGTLRRRMGYDSKRGVINLEQGLINKGLLVVNIAQSGSRPDNYDFTAFCAAITSLQPVNKTSPLSNEEIAEPVNKTSPVTSNIDSKAVNKTSPVSNEEAIEPVNKTSPVVQKAVNKTSPQESTTTASNNSDSEISEILELYFRRLGVISNTLKEIITDTCESLNPPPGETILEWATYAINETAERDIGDKPAWPYAKAILLSIQTKGSLAAHCRRNGNGKGRIDSVPTPMETAAFYGGRCFGTTTPATPPEPEPEPEPDPAAETWDSIKTALQGSMTRSSFDNTLSRTVPVKIDQDILVVEVTNPYAADWLVNRLQNSIDREARSATNGEIIAVRFLVPDVEFAQ